MTAVDEVVDTAGIHGAAVPEISAQQMRDKLKSLDDLRGILAASEPIESIGFGTGHDGIRFQVEDGWAERLGNDHDGSTMVDAFIKIGPVGSQREFRLTKDALLEATSICGLPKKYVERTPSIFIEPQLNYWFRSGLGDRKEYQALVVGEDHRAAAVVKGSVHPFSNLELLDRSLAAITGKYGEGATADVMVDYKYQHSLRRTKFNLIVPEDTRVMQRTGTENDTWSAGLSVSNSLIGLEQTSLAGYLFRWWCTNGAIDTAATSGTWSRKAGQGSEVYDWAQATVDEILGGLEHSFDAVQSMVDVPVDGSVVEVLRDIFKEYSIPNAERERVIENMVDSDQLNMYGVMQAITMVANRADIDPGHMQELMRVGGELPHTAHLRCNLGKVHRH